MIAVDTNILIRLLVNDPGQPELGHWIAGFRIRFGMARVRGKGEIRIGSDLTFKLMLFHWYIPMLKEVSSVC